MRSRWWGAAAILAACGPALAGGPSSPTAVAEAAILAQLSGAAAPAGAAPARLTPAVPSFVRFGAPLPAVSAASRRELVPLAEAAASQHGLDIEFFKRLIHQESGYNPNAVSPAGAQGVAQFMPRTAAMVGLDDPFDPRKALPKSAEHLASLRQRLGNDGLAAAAYNAGEGRVRAWLAGRSGLPLETQNYVAAITGRLAQDWAPGGSGPLMASAARAAPPGGSVLPVFARSQSAEWLLGTRLLGAGQQRLASLLDTAPRPARPAARRSASASAGGGERALCASLGCVVSAAY